MFKDAEKISRSIDGLMKIAVGLEEERQNEMLNVINELAKVHQHVLGDLLK